MMPMVCGRIIVTTSIIAANDDKQEAWDTLCELKTGQNEKKGDVLIDLVLLPPGAWQQRLLDVIV